MKKKDKKKVKIAKQFPPDDFASDAAKKTREKLIKELGKLNEKN